jgi:methylglutaconyl-CoA hydratase
MPNQELTIYERRGQAAWITLNSPAKRNALSAALVRELIDHLKCAHADDSVRAVVMTGAGSTFCAGADLKNRGDMGEPGGRGGNPFVDLMTLMRDGPKPVVCAVNGAAFGGGIGLLASADISIAVEGAEFSFREVRLGVIPAMISVVVLPKLGPHLTTRLFLTGERFSSERALDYGLLHRVVAPEGLEAAAQAEVEAISKGGPNAIREAKFLLRKIARLSEKDAFAYAERQIAELFASEEAAEGIAAFSEKRAPEWVRERKGTT